MRGVFIVKSVVCILQYNYFQWNDSEELACCSSVSRFRSLDKHDSASSSNLSSSSLKFIVNSSKLSVPKRSCYGILYNKGTHVREQGG